MTDSFKPVCFHNQPRWAWVTLGDDEWLRSLHLGRVRAVQSKGVHSQDGLHDVGFDDRRYNQGHLIQLPHQPLQVGEVRIAVHRVGLCRTDLQQLRRSRHQALCLGHEGSGMVLESQDIRFEPGQKVMWFPYTWDIQEEKWQAWGVDIQGVCANSMVVPGDALMEMPVEWSWELGAYYEPVLAGMAPFKGREDWFHGKMIGIFGEGRIAHLAELIASSLGALVWRLKNDEQDQWPVNALDGLIECQLANAPWSSLLKTLKSKALIVLKSRGHFEIPIPSKLTIEKEWAWCGAWYGEPATTIEWMSLNAQRLQPLLGPTFPMTEEGIRLALQEEQKEQQKIFINPQQFARYR